MIVLKKSELYAEVVIRNNKILCGDVRTNKC